MNKIRMQQEQRGIKAEMGFDQAQSDKFADKYGSKGSTIVDLSNKVAAGQMTQTEAMALVSKDPTMLALAAQMISNNDMVFGG